MGPEPNTPENLTCTHLNSLLLWHGYDRVGEGFFCLFFGNGDAKASVSWSRFLVGVYRFRVLALLRWGNIKFGFKTWKTAARTEIERHLQSFERRRPEYYSARGAELNRVEEIPLASRPLLGYLMDDRPSAERDAARQTGRQNFARYLIYDHMDVYVATSMRESDHFWHVAGVVRGLEASDVLKELNLRVYDPTLSFVDGRAAKGLQEALMLLRCRCCVYCLQQSDSFGKDSELASVLAQGKPVIVYAPGKQALQTEFRELRERCGEAKVSLRDVLTEKLKRIGEDEDALRGTADEDALQFVLEKEAQCYEKRVETLRKMHPLALQVNIQTGVANGVLIARSMEECARLTYQIMLRELRFRVRSVGNGEPECTVGLYERDTSSLFRISTGDELLTNTFWNFHEEDLARPSARHALPPATQAPNGT